MLVALDAVGPLADQGEEFLTGFLLVAEAAQHRRCHGGGVLFFYAAHHHAEMAGFDDYAYALGLDYFLDGFSDLGGEALLNLQAAGEEFDQARNFAEPDYFAVRDVGYVHFAEEGQQVVLTEAEHFYVFDDDHLVVFFVKERAFEQGFGILLVAFGEELHRFVDALGRGGEAFAVGIFAEADQHFMDQVFEGGAGQGRRFFFRVNWGWFHAVV
jgi:hypothetical protein